MRFLTQDAPFLRAIELRFLRFHKSQLPAGSQRGPQDVQDLARQAKAELKWLVDHVKASQDRQGSLSRDQRRQLLSLALRVTRRHEPLSYVLGTRQASQMML